LVFFQESATSSEAKPTAKVTEQTWTESAFIIRGKENNIPAWHYILVPYYKRTPLNSSENGATIDITEFGSVIQYRDDRGRIRPMSGWGTDPPAHIQKWIHKHYGM
jgi:hypothetical protein